MPLAQRNSSKSSGYISMISSEPTGTELMPGSFVFDNLRCCFFSSSPYPCTPSSEPVAITSKRPSSLKNFSEVRASGHSIFCTKKRCDTLRLLYEIDIDNSLVVCFCEVLCYKCLTTLTNTHYYQRLVFCRIFPQGKRVFYFPFQHILKRFCAAKIHFFQRITIISTHFFQRILYVLTHFFKRMGKILSFFS